MMDCLCDEIPRFGFRIGSPRQVLYDTEVRSIAMDVAEVGVLKLAQNESICFYRVHFAIFSTAFCCLFVGYQQVAGLLMKPDDYEDLANDAPLSEVTL